MENLAPERWNQIDALFEAALSRPASERGRFLRDACGNDTQLLENVTGLLAVTEEARALLGESATVYLEDVIPELNLRQITDLQPGDPVGAYRIIREIGRGGMGTVYLVERADRHFEKRMAMKIVKRGMDTDEILRRFHHERQILASLEHPNIARLYDGGALPDGRPFLVMEYVEGEPITDYCNRLRLTVDERLRLFVTACRAVQFAHQNLVVHRDLKPSNVLVTGEGDVRLLDFGIAKLLQPDADEADPGTRPWMRLVTPEYASPEQMKGERITTASDVFSLGVILFEMLTGSRPDTRILPGVDGDHAPATRPSRVAADRKDPHVFANRRTTPASLKRRLQGDLDNIAATALSPGVEHRYQSAEQLLRDVERHFSGHPLMARAETLGYRFSKFVRRNRAATAAAVAIFLVTLLFGVVSWVQRQETVRERDTARLERDKANEVVSFVQSLFDASNPFALEPDRLDTLRLRDFLGRSTERVQQDLETQPEVQAHLKRVLGRAYLHLGLYEEARPLLERSLEMRRGFHGGPHEDVAKSLTDMAVLLFSTGNYDESRVLYEEALAMFSVLPGDHREHIGAAKHSLAVLLKDIGEHEASEALHRESLADLRGILGDEHPRIAIVLNGLGLLLQQMSRFEDAEELLRESLELRRAIYGDDHPNTSVALNNLAVLLHRRGDLENAETAMREALRINRAALGSEHPNIAGNTSTLASLLRDMGRHEEAERYFRESTDMRRRLFGEESREMSVVLSNYASLLRHMERYDEAEAVAREALDVTRAALGDEHFGVAIVTGNLAAVLQARGDLAEASALYREAIASMNRVWPDGHLRISLLETNLGNTLLQLGEFDEAERFLLRAYEGLDRYQGPDHPQTREALEILARLYREIDNPEEARRYEELAMRAAE